MVSYFLSDCSSSISFSAKELSPFDSKCVPLFNSTASEVTSTKATNIIKNTTNSIPNIASNAKPAHLLYAIKTMLFIALYPILFNSADVIRCGNALRLR